LRRELLYAAGKLSEVRIYQDGATLSEVRQLAYDGQGRLASITYRDGSMVATRTRTLGYDGAGLLSVIEDEAL
jgi:YD repeat-containing protein